MSCKRHIGFLSSLKTSAFYFNWSHWSLVFSLSHLLFVVLCFHVFLHPLCFHCHKFSFYKYCIIIWASKLHSFLKKLRNENILCLLKHIYHSAICSFMKIQVSLWYIFSLWRTLLSISCSAGLLVIILWAFVFIFCLSDNISVVFIF